MTSCQSARTRVLLLSLGIWLLSGLAACSARQGHAGAQSWQRSQCLKIIDAQERLRCLRDADTSYEQYQREADAVRQRP